MDTAELNKIQEEYNYVLECIRERDTDDSSKGLKDLVNKKQRLWNEILDLKSKLWLKE